MRELLPAQGTLNPSEVKGPSLPAHPIFIVGNLPASSVLGAAHTQDGYPAPEALAT